MGLAGYEIALLAVTAAATTAEAYEQYNAAQSQSEALDLQSQQQTIAYQDKTLSNYDAMEKVLQAQEAQMTVRGTAFSSPSFNAIQRDTENTGARNQRNLDTEESIAQMNIQIEKQNVNDTLWAQLFGDAGNMSKSGMSAASKMPTMQ